MWDKNVVVPTTSEHKDRMNDCLLHILSIMLLSSNWIKCNVYKIIEMKGICKNLLNPLHSKQASVPQGMQLFEQPVK